MEGGVAPGGVRVFAHTTVEGSGPSAAEVRRLTLYTREASGTAEFLAIRIVAAGSRVVSLTVFEGASPQPEGWTLLSFQQDSKPVADYLLDIRNAFAAEGRAGARRVVRDAVLARRVRQEEENNARLEHERAQQAAQLPVDRAGPFARQVTGVEAATRADRESRIGEVFATFESPKASVIQVGSSPGRLALSWTLSGRVEDDCTVIGCPVSKRYPERRLRSRLLRVARDLSSARPAVQLEALNEVLGIPGVYMTGLAAVRPPDTPYARLVDLFPLTSASRLRDIVADYAIDDDLHQQSEVVWS